MSTEAVNYLQLNSLNHTIVFDQHPAMHATVVSRPVVSAMHKCCISHSGSHVCSVFGDTCLLQSDGSRRSASVASSDTGSSSPERDTSPSPGHRGQSVTLLATPILASEVCSTWNTFSFGASQLLIWSLTTVHICPDAHVQAAHLAQHYHT